MKANFVISTFYPIMSGWEMAHLSRTWQMRKHEGKRTLVRPMCRWKDLDPRNIRHGGIE